MKHILILGSEGFIGKHLVNYLIAKGQQVTGADLFEAATGKYNYIKVSRLSPEWDEIFENEAFDFCINAAGSGNVPYSMTHPVSDFESNTLDVIRILDNIRRHNPVCKYIQLSSAAVYGNPEVLPILEEAKKHPLSPYGWHKLMSEQLCTEYYQLFKIGSCVVRPFSVYGPGLKKQLFWDLFQKYRNNKERIEMWGSGNESRDFIYIADLVVCLHLLMQHAPMEGEVYNLATGEEVTIKEASGIFARLLPGNPAIVFNGQTRKGDPLNWRADISKLKALGFHPSTTMEKGLSDYVNWVNQYSA